MNGPDINSNNNYQQRKLTQKEEKALIQVRDSCRPHGITSVSNKNKPFNHVAKANINVECSNPSRRSTMLEYTKKLSSIFFINHNFIIT